MTENDTGSKGWPTEGCKERYSKVCGSNTNYVLPASQQSDIQEVSLGLGTNRDNSETIREDVSTLIADGDSRQP